MRLPHWESEYTHDQIIRYYGIRLIIHQEALKKRWQQRQCRYHDLLEVINAIYCIVEYDDTGEISEIKWDITLYHDIMHRIVAVKAELIKNQLAEYSREKVFTILDAVNRDTATALSCIRRAQADTSDKLDHRRWYDRRMEDR